MHPGFEIGAVYLCREPVDFRKSIGGLSALVEETFGVSALSGGLFLFVNRRYNRLKILYWHRRGFCLWYQRLEQERYAWVPKASLLIRPNLVRVSVSTRSSAEARGHDPTTPPR